MSDVKNLLKHVINKDGAKFTSHLNDMVVDRISDELESRKMEIASSFIKPESKESVELDEERANIKLGKGRPADGRGARKFQFPSNKQANQFSKDIANSGVGTGDVKGNKVIGVITSGSPTVTKSAITKYLKKNKGKELKESVELDEGTYTFKKSSDAYNFMKAATEAGVKKNFLKMKGKSVTVTGIKDKDMIQMLGLITKDMKGTVSESISNILNGEDGEQVVFEDGSSRFITKNEANSLAEIHDSLNSDEREEFINKISESSDIVETLLNI